MLKWKTVMRYSPDERLYRLFRITTDGRWPEIPSRKLSFAWRCRWCWNPLRIHYVKSYGGRFG